MRRRAKSSSVKSKEIFAEVIEELALDGMPKVLNCPIKTVKNGAYISRCVANCVYKCPTFKNFTYITGKCTHDGCTLESPCLDCLEEIQNVKVLIQCIKALPTKKQKADRHFVWMGKVGLGLKKLNFVRKYRK